MSAHALLPVDEDFDFDRIDFVTSDHHFGHERIIELADRPFGSVDQMHQRLISEWNRVVGPDDTVLHLGDLALGNRVESIGITATLNGRKLLVPGNHDTISTVYHCSEQHKQQTRDLLAATGWQVLEQTLIGERRGRALSASHFPYTGDSHGVDRYAAARPANHGLPLLHGHTHSRENGAHGGEFHVGVDGHGFAPVSMRAIDEWLAALSPGEQR